MTTAYLALGANLGDRAATLSKAKAALNGHPDIEVTAASSLYQTAPVGGPPGQGDYFNAVLRVTTRLSPQALLTVCLDLEQRFGRQRLEPSGPRTLDIDLLFYDEAVCRNPELTLPHSRLHLRRFVLAPLFELAPDLRHPLLGRTIRDLLNDLDDPSGVQRLPDPW